MPDWSELERVMIAAVGDVFPAAQLVVLEALEVALARAYGAAGRDTLFDVASLTKALSTTTLTMRLIARGALALDDEPRPGITVRHLLSHSSGLPAWRPLAAPPGPGAPADPEVRRQVIESVLREPLDRPPGERSVYSDLGFILLGDAVERAGGARLDAQFEDGVAAPLGVGATFHPDPGRCAPAEGLQGVVHDDNARAMGGVAGHAGLFATAEDVATIARALLAAWRGDEPPGGPAPGGALEPIVPTEIVRAFFRPAGVPGSTWALGWDRPSPAGSSAGSRWPRDGVGHLGFTGCSLWLDPARGRAVVLLSNRVEPTRANERIKALRPVVHDAVVAALDGALA